MHSVTLTVDQKFFNLLWRGLHAREKELLAEVERLGPESDDGSALLNDVVYVRLCQQHLKREAIEAELPLHALSLAEGFVDLRDLLPK